MRIVYIAHPISGDIQNNLRKIATIVRAVNLEYPDVVPFVPYYADCVALNDHDPMHRERGIKNDAEIFGRNIIDELWVYGDALSKGILAECELAYDNQIPVFLKSTITITDFIDKVNARVYNHIEKNNNV